MANKFTFILLVACLVTSQNVTACSCDSLSLSQQVSDANFIGVGVILSRKQIQMIDSARLKPFLPIDTTDERHMNATISLFSSNFFQYKLLVEELIKGKAVGDTVMVYSGMGSGDCGYRFIVGRRYLVYGVVHSLIGTNELLRRVEGRDRYWTNICTLTADYKPHDVDLLKEFLHKKKR